MDEAPQSRAAYFRNAARQLRDTARSMIDLRRRAQLIALAEGFERFADRLEQAELADDEK